MSNASFATQSGTWNINNISGTVSLPTGASTATLQNNRKHKPKFNRHQDASLKWWSCIVESNLVQGLTDTQLRASAVPVSGVPVGLSSSPLPTGAATESTLAALNNKFNTNSFSNINTNTTSTVKSGAGVLKELLLTKLVYSFKYLHNLRQHNSNRDYYWDD